MSDSYTRSGVNYSQLDPIKILAQKAGLNTSRNLNFLSFKEVGQSRGESAYVIEGKDHYLAFVQEGLGTKNLVADSMRNVKGKTYYDAIARDTVAMIVNDLITVGAHPMTVQAYWAVGDSSWFTDRIRSSDLISGWKKACDEAGAVWGGGETPTLKGIISKSAIDLAGSACGIVTPKEKLVTGEMLRDGDQIVLLSSSGIHANGITLARKLAENLPDGFKTKLPSGKFYGEVLLTPTIIYAKLISEIINKGIRIHYMVNITGHGWRKLMRARKNYSYVINNLPPVHEIFHFVQKHSQLTDREMYETFNMGAGFAVYVSEKDADSVVAIANKVNIKAFKAGMVVKGPKQVVIAPLKITYSENDLSIRI